MDVAVVPETADNNSLFSFVMKCRNNCHVYISTHAVYSNSNLWSKITAIDCCGP